MQHENSCDAKYAIGHLLGGEGEAGAYSKPNELLASRVVLSTLYYLRGIQLINRSISEMLSYVRIILYISYKVR